MKYGRVMRGRRARIHSTFERRAAGVALSLALSVALVAGAGCEGCGADADDAADTPPPDPPPPPPPAPVDVEPEVDAGEAPDAGDADAGAPQKPQGFLDPAGIRRCCDALEQNSKSAPPNLVGAYQAAAAACRGIKASPKAGQQIAALGAMLMGAGLPPACR